MATVYSNDSPAADRRSRRRQIGIDEALDHAVRVMGESGVGSLSISEVARRMGIRGPSLYRYFDSLSALYDALFALGQERNARVVQEAIALLPPGVDRIRAGTRAVVRWCADNPALAQLLYWRVIPGFEPSAETFAAGIDAMGKLRGEFSEAVRAGQLDARADSDEAALLLTIQISGLITQQFANEPGATFEQGRFTALTDSAIDLVLNHYRSGGHDAVTGS